MVQPEDLDLASIPGGAVVGRRVVSCGVVSSTMDIARKEASAGAIEGTIVIASRQVSGRGRRGREWISPPGSLALSLVLYPRVDMLPQLVMLSATAVARAISRSSSLCPLIKWPNDILLGGKKVAGILLENSFQGGKLVYSIVGIGVNVNVAGDTIANIPGATSLLVELGRSVPFSLLVNELIVAMDGFYQLLREGDAELIYEEWRDLQAVLGQEVVVEAGARCYKGRAANVSRDGRLWIKDASGKLIPFSGGEVTYCRLRRE